MSIRATHGGLEPGQNAVPCVAIDSLDVRHKWVTAFVQRIYLKTYRARIPTPSLRFLVRFDGEGRVAGAAGLRTASDGFFSEIYLDAPVEAMLRGMGEANAQRSRIAEICHLVCDDARLTAAFIRSIAIYAHEAGFRWLFFTLTRRLAAYLVWRKACLVPLGPALAQRIDNVALWGDYYRHEPYVYAVRLMDESRRHQFIFPAA